MKKSILLGVAALAAVTFAGASADAGEVKLGGYYMFRAINADDNILDEGNNAGRRGADDLSAWAHRLQMNVDMKASEKSHAHARIRVVDSQSVAGADVGTRTGMLSEDNHANGTGTTVSGVGANGLNGASGNDLDWDIRQLWLETEAWGVGVKVGEMPLAMNDNILVNHDTSSFGTIMLSKSFGDMTLVGAMVKVKEENIGGGTGAYVAPAAAAVGVPAANPAGFSANRGVTTGGTPLGADEDDVDLYALSLLGKSMGINYQATVAYLDAQQDSDVANALSRRPNQDVSDWWVALTLNGQVSGIDLTGTIIYEAGMDNVPNWRTGTTVTDQFEQDDFLVALRAKGKTGFGGWNAYAFYAGEDFTNISPNTMEWSATWDMGGPYGRDLMNTVFDSNAGMGSPSENIWGVGAGLTVNAGGWTIKPMLDYAEVVETNITGAAGTESLIDSAWGGTLILSTPIQQDTVLSLTGQYVDPDMTRTGRRAACAAGTNCEDTMHQLMADIKMTF